MLEGILVVSLEQAVAAPYCTQRLFDAGARVIKVERAEGDLARGYDEVVHGESAYFVWLNHGKESIVLDIKDSADKALLNRMLAHADVFIQNLAPGAAARAGFGSEELRVRHPRLITCDISGYGEHGLARDKKAYDLLIQCETGLTSITGSPDAPGRVGVSVADIACGINSYTAILQALYKRRDTGEGSSIAVSLFDSLAEWMAVPLLHYDYANVAPVRVGLRHPSIAPYGSFSTGDGRTVVIAIQNEREWRRLCESVLEHPEMAHNPEFARNSLRVANRATLDGRIAEIFGQIGFDELTARLHKGGIAYGSVNDIAQLSMHSQLRRITVDTPTGPVEIPASPIASLRQLPSQGDVPRLDSHGAKIREEFT